MTTAWTALREGATVAELRAHIANLKESHLVTMSRRSLDTLEHQYGPDRRTNLVIRKPGEPALEYDLHRICFCE